MGSPTAMLAPGGPLTVSCPSPLHPPPPVLPGADCEDIVPAGCVGCFSPLWLCLPACAARGRAQRTNSCLYGDLCCGALSWEEVMFQAQAAHLPGSAVAARPGPARDCIYHFSLIPLDVIIKISPTFWCHATWEVESGPVLMTDRWGRGQGRPEPGPQVAPCPCRAAAPALPEWDEQSRPLHLPPPPRKRPQGPGRFLA